MASSIAGVNPLTPARDRSEMASSAAKRKGACDVPRTKAHAMCPERGAGRRDQRNSPNPIMFRANFYTAWPRSRDAPSGNVTGVTYHDGHGSLVRKSLKVNSALELSGASVCTQTGTTTGLNLADFFRANSMKYEVIAFAPADETIKAY